MSSFGDELWTDATLHYASILCILYKELKCNNVFKVQLPWKPKDNYYPQILNGTGKEEHIPCQGQEVWGEVTT